MNFEIEGWVKVPVLFDVEADSEEEAIEKAKKEIIDDLNLGISVVSVENLCEEVKFYLDAFEIDYED